MNNLLSLANSPVSGISMCVLLAGTFSGCGMSSQQRNSVPPPLGSAAITGTIVDYSTQQPIDGALVYLEQPDTNAVDRTQAKTKTGGDGSFLFSGMHPGNYDIVADASVPSQSGAVSTYATTMTLAVPTGTNVANIPLVPEHGVGMPNGLPITIEGVVSSAGERGGTPVDAALVALQGTLSSSTQGKYTIPVFPGSTERVTTGVTSFCAAANDCVSYQLLLPASMPVIGAFSSGGTKYTIPPPDPVEVLYVIQANAYTPGTSTPDCAPSVQTGQPIVPIGSLVSANPSVGFAGCQ